MATVKIMPKNGWIQCEFLKITSPYGGSTGSYDHPLQPETNGAGHQAGLVV